MKKEIKLIFYVSIIVVGFCALILFVQKKNLAWPPITPTSKPTDMSSSNSPKTQPPIQETATEEVNAETPSIMPCAPQYPPPQAGWISSYEARSPISLGELFIQKYGDIRRDNFDLYAIAYYNNRKALEKKTFDAIDPVQLDLDRGGNYFLPPLGWINQYRDFPIPILEAANRDNVDPRIKVSGTSLLYPLSSQISKCFKEATSPYQIYVEPASNTNLGLADYCRGRSDIFGGSEDITSEMLTESGCTGVDFLHFEIAVDAIVLFINNNNSYAKQVIEAPLTNEELKRLIFSANTWGEVRSNWGDETINRYFPPRESGAFEVVKNEIFPDLNTEYPIPNLFVDKSDNFSIGMVVNDSNSIGFSSYSSYQLNNINLMALSIDGVSPNLDTISADDSGYPLTRKLYLSTGTTTYNEKPLIRFFISYYLAYEFDFLDELGYFYPNNFDLLNNPNTIP
jgi:phosphate transport system substrate-binding protein